ncbi:MAG: protein kinase [Planctomycetaceae bacterium]|jgi:serine/threonine protein kinase|nr:protein kinase [Planctomycetaceae bacterium]
MDSQEIKEKFQQLLDDYHSNRIDWKTFEQQLFELKSLRLGISASEHNATERFSDASQTASAQSPPQTTSTASQILPSRFSSTAVSKSRRFSLQPPPENSLPMSLESQQNKSGITHPIPAFPFVPTTSNNSHNNSHNNSQKKVANSTSTFFIDADSPSRIFRSTGPLQTSRRYNRLDSGTQIGNDYTLQRVLGNGQCGETWLAEENSSGNLVVLKLVPALIQRDEKSLDRVSDSFRRVLKLKYSGICPVFRLAQDEILGSFFVSAFLDALPLNQYYERYCQLYQDFPFTVAVQLLIPVSQALDFAHRKKIVHRMLKPQNILIGKRCGVVVTDFEFTETVRREMLYLGVTTNTPTTAFWKAPEVWTDKNYSPYSDQFALGVLACQLITGSLPFQGENDTECRENILRTEPILDESLPEQTQIALRKVLSKNAGDRFSTCYDFVKELSESLRLNPVEQTPETKIWSFSEKETILDPQNTFQQQNQTFPYTKNPKNSSVISELIPYNLISLRAGLIAIFLTIMILGGGIVFWKFTATSNSPDSVTTQNDHFTENDENNRKRSGSDLPFADKTAVLISTEELEQKTRLADEGNIEAQRDLGEIYFYGKGGVKPNYQKAIQYFQLGAQQGDTVSLYHIGRCFELGLGGLPHDTNHAVSIYKRAKGFPKADEALKRLKVKN